MQYDRPRVNRAPSGRDQHLYTAWASRQVNNMRVKERAQMPRVMSRVQRKDFRDAGAILANYRWHW